MKESVNLNFKFKGTRNYVHGTDMYNDISKWIELNGYQNIEGIDMSIHKISKKNLSGYITDEITTKDKTNPNVIFSFISNKNVFKIVLFENNEEVKGSYEYKENEIVEASIIEEGDQKISLNIPMDYTAIEKIVAMNKALHEHLLINAIGKWYFTKLQLNKSIYLIKPSKIEVKLIKNLNNYLTKSYISIDGDKIGNIFFSIV
ncbi:MAG: hypothetical protein A2W99_04745 [Bacteroidetes bacterium GWF2_33_16]|nr:MAG: hypothetical protein A2X00_17265 [Bacteroidetes bacterium GWE2_32_14]OFY05977.1 MAG: hypothetical protein A2W99_04745 [Bacteroidetes bacterium GWF2_33_16]